MKKEKGFSAIEFFIVVAIIAIIAAIAIPNLERARHLPTYPVSSRFKVVDKGKMELPEYVDNKWVVYCDKKSGNEYLYILNGGGHPTITLLPDAKCSTE